MELPSPLLAFQSPLRVADVLVDLPLEFLEDELETLIGEFPLPEEEMEEHKEEEDVFLLRFEVVGLDEPIGEFFADVQG
jgi:hypothetical protein